MGVLQARPPASSSCGSNSWDVDVSLFRHVSFPSFDMQFGFKNWKALRVSPLSDRLARRSPCRFFSPFTRPLLRNAFCLASRIATVGDSCPRRRYLIFNHGSLVNSRHVGRNNDHSDIYHSFLFAGHAQSSSMNLPRPERPSSPSSWLPLFSGRHRVTKPAEKLSTFVCTTGFYRLLHLIYGL